MGQDKVFATFFLHGEAFAIDAIHVREVINCDRDFPKIPGSPKYLKGILNLRGLLIPVIELNLYFNKIQKDVFEEDDCKLAIVEFEDSVVAIGFSQIDSIIKLKEEDIVQKGSGDLFNSFVAFKDSFIQVLQVDSLIKSIRVKSGEMFEEQKKFFEENVRKKRISKKGIKFKVDDIDLLVKISDVKEIVNLENIEDTSYEYSSLLGRIVIRGETIPVFDLAQLLDIKNMSNIHHHVMIIDSEFGKYALVVDRIETIYQYFEDELRPVLAIENKFKDLYSSMIHYEDRESLIVFDPLKLTNEEDIKIIITGFPKIYPKVATIQKTQDMAVKFNRRSLITFKSGRVYGMDIQNISEITELRDNLVESPYIPQNFCGFLNLRGQLIPLVNPIASSGRTKMELTEGSKIIIFDNNGAKIGLFVEEICSIINCANSDYSVLKNRMPHSVLNGGKCYFDDEVIETVKVKSDEGENLVIVLSKDMVLRKLVSSREHVEKNRASV